MPTIKPFTSLVVDGRHVEIPSELRGGHLAIGNFDGMHRGHHGVIALVNDRAAAGPGPALVLTFEPHPRDYFGKSTSVFRLTPPEIRERLAKAMGLAGVITLNFDEALADLTAEAFIRTILVDALAVRSVAIGWNFHFGKGRSGNAALLREQGLVHGFKVQELSPFTDESGNTISSSRIRDLLSEGLMGEAAGLLGWRWLFAGEIIHGDKRGRTIGYPTANIRLPSHTRLAHGIYAVLVDIDGARHKGVASYGRRPTFDNGAPVFESFIFDFTGDLYGKTVFVTPVSYLRPELKFDSVEALVTQMDRDSAEARQLLDHLSPGTLIDQALAPVEL